MVDVRIMIVAFSMVFLGSPAFGEDPDSPFDVQDPLEWTNEYMQGIRDDGADQLVRFGVSMGASEMQARSQSFELASLLRGGTIQEMQVMAYTSCGEAVRQIFVYVLMDPIQPIFFRFDFFRVGENWLVGGNSFNTRIHELRSFNAPTCEALEF